MATNATRSQIINKLKTQSKGGWAKARTVEPKARSGGGLPPNLKNAVAVCKTYKLGLASNGNPFFALGLVLKEPEDLQGRRATVNWFLAEGLYNTLEEAEVQLANDLGLMLPNKDIPEEYDDILEKFKDLCERGVHILINTGRERKGKMPNIFIQGLAEGWKDTPEEGAGEAEDRPARSEATNGQAPTRQAATNRPAPRQEDDHPVDDQPPEDDVQEVVEEAGDDEVYIPKKGDPYDYTHKGKKDSYKVIASYPDKEKVDLQQVKAAKGKKPTVLKGVPFAKLESSE